MPGRADEQHTLRNSPADARVLLRGLQELDDLPELLFGLVDARDVAKPHDHVVFGVDLRAAAGERHHATLGTAHPPEEEAPERDEEDERNDPAEDLADPAARHLAGVLDAVCLEILDQLGIVDADRREAPRLAVGFLRAP